MKLQVSRKRTSPVSTRGSKKISAKASSSHKALSSSPFSLQEKSSAASGLQFPFKLHYMLDNASDQGYDTIVSWDGNNGFKVHNKDAFVADIVPKYFCLTKYRSFQRLLNMWSFERVRSGPSKGSYVHKNFKRGEPTLCNSMKCEKIKKSPKKSSLNEKNTTTTTTVSFTPLQASIISCDEETPKGKKTDNKEKKATEASPEFEGMHFQLVSENLDKVMMEDEEMCLPNEDDALKEKEEESQEILPPLALFSLVQDFRVEDDFQLLDLDMQKV